MPEPRSVKCPNCSAPMLVPLGETEMDCDFCDSRVRFLPANEEMEVVRTREEMKTRERVALAQARMRQQLDQEEYERWRQTAARVAVAVLPVIGRGAARILFDLALRRGGVGCLGCGCLLPLLALLAGTATALVLSRQPSPSGRLRPMSAKVFKVGLVQMAMSSDPEANLQKAVAGVGAAAAAGATVVCLPELFRSPYFCQKEDARLFDLAEPVPGPSTEALGRAAKKLGVVVVAPVFERRAAGLYHNSAAILDATGEIVGLYRKMHIPDDPCYYEKFYFTPGDLGFQAFDTRAGRIGTLICWDQWYPEGARLTALRGAMVLFYPTAIGWHPHEKESFGAAQRDAWRTIQRGHAIANGLYVAVANRVGHEKATEGEPGIEFWGSSFVADPFGRVLAEGSLDKEEIVVAEVDLARIEETRRNWPFLRDRRIDAYAGLEKRFLD